MVCVIGVDGKPLMPTKRHGWVRRALRDGRATVVHRCPFTIRLTYESEKNTQPGDMGLDSGYAHVGFSVVNELEELIGGVLALLTGMSDRLEKKNKHRGNRRIRLWFRKPGYMFDTKGEDWLAPSIQHKLDSQVRLVELLRSIVPVKSITVEVAGFDIQRVKNPDIAGVQYQQGERFGFENIREYVLHRDGHKCRKCGKKTLPLQVHHLGYWHGDRRDHQDNLITLCIKCHTPANHAENGFLHGWKPRVKNFRGATFMTTVRWKLLGVLRQKVSVPVTHTYGHITKSKRIDLSLSKSHGNDAFVIAGGSGQIRHRLLQGVQNRRNNRSLETFYDALYMDTRDKKVKKGSELHSGRQLRSREDLPESLRKYRGHKIKKGRRNIRTSRHPIQSGDLVRYQGRVYTSGGMHCLGKRVILKETGKSVAKGKIELVRYGQGIRFNLQPHENSDSSRVLNTQESSLCFS